MPTQEELLAARILRMKVLGRPIPTVIPATTSALPVEPPPPDPDPVEPPDPDPNPLPADSTIPVTSVSLHLFQTLLGSLALPPTQVFFDKEYQAGQFVTGIKYVIADGSNQVRINSYTPGWSGGNNGVQLDMELAQGTQGFNANAWRYNDAYNVGAPLPIIVDVSTKPIRCLIFSQSAFLGDPGPVQEIASKNNSVRPISRKYEFLFVIRADHAPPANAFAPFITDAAGLDRRPKPGNQYYTTADYNSAFWQNNITYSDWVSAHAQAGSNGSSLYSRALGAASKNHMLSHFGLDKQPDGEVTQYFESQGSHYNYGRDSASGLAIAALACSTNILTAQEKANVSYQIIQGGIFSAGMFMGSDVTGVWPGHGVSGGGLTGAYPDWMIWAGLLLNNSSWYSRFIDGAKEDQNRIMSLWYNQCRIYNSIYAYMMSGYTPVRKINGLSCWLERPAVAPYFTAEKNPRPEYRGCCGWGSFACLQLAYIANNVDHLVYPDRHFDYSDWFFPRWYYDNNPTQNTTNSSMLKWAFRELRRKLANSGRRAMATELNFQELNWYAT